MKVKDRIKALESAYSQLIGALSQELDTKEVEPEKRKTAMSMYKLAQEDSRKIFDELIELKGLVLISVEDAEALEEHKLSTKSVGLSPEQRMNR